MYFFSAWECWRKGSVFHPLLSLNSNSQPMFFLSCNDLIIFIVNNLWLCVLWPTSFHTLRKCTYPLQLHDTLSFDLSFTLDIRITDSLIGYGFSSHLWIPFLSFEELTVTWWNHGPCCLCWTHRLCFWFLSKHLWIHDSCTGQNRLAGALAHPDIFFRGWLMCVLHLIS